MCGRFALKTPIKTIADEFEVTETALYAPRYNIAPSQPVLVVRLNKETVKREATFMMWGLVPSWAKDPGIGQKMINARAETVAEKPSYRGPFKNKRCLIPADGFYEWQKLDKGKLPYYFHLKSGRLFAFAGLWEFWEDNKGNELFSCTLLTTQANETMSPIHQRMPVILKREQYRLWLDPATGTIEALRPLLQPLPSTEIEAYPVSSRVNNPDNDDEKCMEPVR